MGHVEGGVLLFATDQFDGVHQLLGIGIIEQEWKALNGFVRQAAAEPVSLRIMSMALRCNKLNTAIYTDRRPIRISPLCRIKMPPISAPQVMSLKVKASASLGHFCPRSTGPSSVSSAMWYGSRA